MPYDTSGRLGANVANVDTVQSFELGAQITCDDGTVRRYVKASAAIAANDALKADVADGSYSLRPTAAVNEPVEAVSPVAIAAASFGWVVIEGPVTVKAAATTAAGAQLGATAVAGTLGVKAISATYVQGEVQATQAIGAGKGLIARTAEAGGTLTALLR